jgi:hypothetical protein
MNTCKNMRRNSWLRFMDHRLEEVTERAEVVMGPDNVREETLRQLMMQYKSDLMLMCFAFLKNQI